MGFRLVGWSLLLISWELAAAEPARKVLFVGIDGCRWDAVQAAKTPHLDRLVAEGYLAVGTDIIAPRETPGDTVSGPGWSNLLCGVWPDKHGVVDNSFKGANYQRYPHFFARIKEVRPQLVTASFVNWTPIHTKILSAADEVFTTEDVRGAAAYTEADVRVVEACCACLRTKQPDVVMLYLGQVDETGHAYGFHPTVAPYREAIERVDAHLGRVLETIQLRPRYAQEDWLILVATDHGGVGLNHGGGRQTDEIRKTFLIVSGPSAQRGKTEEATYQVDVVATALAHLQIIPRVEWGMDGRPVGLKTVPSR